jgi:hypothetical protein
MTCNMKLRQVPVPGRRQVLGGMTSALEFLPSLADSNFEEVVRVQQNVLVVVGSIASFGEAHPHIWVRGTGNKFEMLHARSKMISKIPPGGFPPIYGAPYQCCLANIFDPKLWTTDDVVLA